MQTINALTELLVEGGKVVWVAPSGGRDRPDTSGAQNPSSFSPWEKDAAPRDKPRTDRPGADRPNRSFSGKSDAGNPARPKPTGGKPAPGKPNPRGPRK